MEVGEYKNQIKSERKAKQKQAREEGGAKEGKEGKKFKERLICYDLVRGFHIPVLGKVHLACPSPICLVSRSVKRRNK